MPITQTEIDAASIDGDVKPILSEFVARIESLETGSTSDAEFDTVATFQIALLNKLKAAGTEADRIAVYDSLIAVVSPTL